MRTTTDRPGEHREQPEVRRPYRPPAILSRDRLEAIAGVCDARFGGKGNPNCGTPSS